jgi:TetR/AcrR family tetracycline transcriptional repressor
MTGERVPLTRDRIVHSALELARDEGLSGVSMRKLAQELGVEAMSLYHHVPNKRALLILMAERSLSTLPPVDPTLQWSERLVRLLEDIFRAGVENPAMITVLAAQDLDPGDADSSESSEFSALGLIESVLSILAESGLEPRHRVHVYNSLINLIYGFVVTGTSSAGGPKAVLPPAGRSGRPTDRSASYPALGALLEELDTADPASDLLFSLELYVGALARAVDLSR